MPVKGKKIKTVILFAALLIVIGAAVNGTVAFLFTNTGDVINTFVPGSVTGEITETFNSDSKTSAKIKNTGNVTAYVRVAVAGTEVDEQGHVIGDLPVAGFIDASKWDLVGGYYYFKGSVAPGAYTEDLLASGIPLKITDGTGTHLYQVTIAAQLIQAEGGRSDGTPAVTDAWKMSYSAGLEAGGSWTAAQGN